MLIRGQATAALVRTLRRELRDAAAGNVVTSVVTVDEIITVMGQEILAGIAPLTPLISIGVLLTAAGIYGVLAFAVARRGRELAVRVAMGADRRDLVRLVTMHTLRLVGAGVFFGLGVTFALSRVLRAGGGAGSVFDPAPIAFIDPRRADRRARHRRGLAAGAPRVGDRSRRPAAEFLNGPFNIRVFFEPRAYAIPRAFRSPPFRREVALHAV